MVQIYEQFFYLKYYGGWSFIEAYNLPVGLRTWFVERLAIQLTRENEATEKASGGSSNKGGPQTLSRFNQPPPPAGSKFDMSG